MKRIALLVCIFVFLSHHICDAGVFENKNIPDLYPVEGKTLLLNGAGIRKKFFIKLYVGALYLPSKANTEESIFASGYPSVVKMHFIYSKIEQDKIVETFAEGFKNNAPDMPSEKTQKFLSIFTFPLNADDVVDLVIKDKNSVDVVYNGKKAGSAASDKLGAAVLKIFLGDNPADKNMKAGMLGR